MTSKVGPQTERAEKALAVETVLIKSKSFIFFCLNREPFTFIIMNIVIFLV